MITRIFLAHPAKVDETFFEHMVFAGKFSGKLFLAAGAALVHAFIPCLFEKTASKIMLISMPKHTREAHRCVAGLHGAVPRYFFPKS